MNKKTSIALFLATTSVVALTSTGSSSLKAEESDLGGLKEWNTDMPIEADFILDEQAQKLADEAAKASVCIPIGEGENCCLTLNPSRIIDYEFLNEKKGHLSAPFYIKSRT